MRRISPTRIHDPRSQAVFISRWDLDDADHQTAAAEAALAGAPEARGLTRFSVFRGLDDHGLLILAAWSDAESRDAYLADTRVPRGNVDAAVPGIRRIWRETGHPFRRFAGDPQQEVGCVVLVRQPLIEPDPAVQVEWVDAVVDVLGADQTMTEGLVGATFFTTDDGAQVLNLAEWTSPEAHATALTPDERTPSEVADLWRRVREDPRLGPADVQRCELVGAVEPG